MPDDDPVIIPLVEGDNAPVVTIDGQPHLLAANHAWPRAEDALAATTAVGDGAMSRGVFEEALAVLTRTEGAVGAAWALYKMGLHAGALLSLDTSWERGFRAAQRLLAAPGIAELSDRWTPTQQQVLAAVADGLDYSQIAADRGISPEGVRYHVRMAAKAADLSVADLRARLRKR